tara:strand:+ start:117 stop:602 length:486 start_codon:yes stop_codon:yes gene_type:complete
MRSRYSDAFREKCVRRLLEPDAISVKELVQETGVSQFTLYSWVRKAKQGVFMSKPSKRKGKSWEVDDQIRILAAASALSDEELGAYLRREGVHPDTLDAWRNALMGRQANRATEKRIRDLEAELRRKEKALAEAAALLILQKKAQQIWGGEDESTESETES